MFKRLCNSLKKKSGFSMTELLMVTVTTGTLVSAATPTYLEMAEKARAVEAVVAIAAIKNSEFACKLEAGSYTSELGDLLVKVPSSETIYYWTYSLSDASVTGFTVTATRSPKKAGEGIAGQTIVFRWDDEIAETWSGTHTGVPE